MEQSKQAKYCFNLPNNAYMLCFNKLTSEHNTKKIFVCGSFSFSMAVGGELFRNGTVTIHVLPNAILISPQSNPSSFYDFFLYPWWWSTVKPGDNE